MSKFLVDPINITKYDLDTWELELVLLFWVCAAGKNALSSAKGLEKLMQEITVWGGPFSSIRGFGKRKLPRALKRNGIGCYNNKAKTFWQLANAGFDLKTCSIDELETIKGIGKKTSRCFIMHSRRDARCAGLDVHLLRYLARLGHDVPRTTPGGLKKYRMIEDIFVNLADEANMSVADFDLQVWRAESGNVI